MLTSLEMAALHTAVNNLGILYRRQGDAEKLYDRALAGYEKGLGADHIYTLDTVNNLGILYVDQGHLTDAEKAYARALAGYDKALGADHTRWNGDGVRTRPYLKGVILTLIFWPERGPKDNILN